MTMIANRHESRSIASFESCTKHFSIHARTQKFSHVNAWPDSYVSISSEYNENHFNGSVAYSEFLNAPNATYITQHETLGSSV
jgi:hypothetical protein